MIIIAAMDAQRGIGKNNALPWKLPEDMAFFKRATTGHTVIMGRKTFESIGKPLPNRRNIVVTRSTEWNNEGVEVAHSIEEAMDLAAMKTMPPKSTFVDFTFVIGGAEIYAEALPLATVMYLTKIQSTYDCDTFFPEFNEEKWVKIPEQEAVQSLVGSPSYSRITYCRKVDEV